MSRGLIVLAVLALTAAACGDDTSEGAGGAGGTGAAEECSVDARCPGEGTGCDADGPDEATCAADAEANGLVQVCGEQNFLVFCPAD